MEELKTEELAKKIEERQKLIEEISAFVEEVTRKIGKTTLWSQRSSSTHIIRILDNFQDFSFCADTGQTMYGGEDYSVWYSTDRMQKPVFSVHYQDEKYVVKNFSADNEWLKKLKELMKNKNLNCWPSLSVVNHLEKQRLLKKQEVEKRNRLLKIAKRLAL